MGPILGLFANSYMPYQDEKKDWPDIPSLEEMVVSSLDVLEQRAEGRGIFLLVEGGRIDMAHHDAQAARALEETLSLDRAVKVSTM